MPRTAAAIDHAVDRIRRVADAIGRPVAIENVSAVFEPPGTMPEAEFLAEIAHRADALLLLDVNNIVVNAHNFGFDPDRYLDIVPLERIAQIHIAGHEVLSDGMRVDTHAEPVGSEAMALLDRVLRRVGPRPVLLERDANIPPLDVVLEEVRAIRRVFDDAVAAHTAALTTAPAQELGA
jgi:uncharacterized protein (UPF0276 family)